MANLLKTGSDWLESMREAHCSSPVAYRRGVDSHDLNATYGQTEYEVDDGDGATINTYVVDFLVLASALPFDEPEIGDQVVADGRVYEVLPVSGQGCWRWSDRFSKTMRIHTKDLGPE